MFIIILRAAYLGWLALITKQPLQTRKRLSKSLEIDMCCYYNQGGKCRDILAIYRWYILYRDTLTQYFVEKNRWKSTKNRQYIADISASSAKSPIYGKTTTKKEENRRYFSQLMRYSALLKCLFLCCWGDSNPKQKV